MLVYHYSVDIVGALLNVGIVGIVALSAGDRGGLLVMQSPITTVTHCLSQKSIGTKMKDNISLGWCLLSLRVLFITLVDAISYAAATERVYRRWLILGWS